MSTSETETVNASVALGGMDDLGKDSEYYEAKINHLEKELELANLELVAANNDSATIATLQRELMHETSRGKSLQARLSELRNEHDKRQEESRKKIHTLHAQHNETLSQLAQVTTEKNRLLEHLEQSCPRADLSAIEREYKRIVDQQKSQLQMLEAQKLKSEQDLYETREAVAQLKQRLLRLQNAFDTHFSASARRMHENIAQSEATDATWQHRLAQKDQEISSLQARLEQAQEQIEAQNVQLAQEQRRYAELQRDNEQNNSGANTIQAFEHSIDSLKEEMQAQQEVFHKQSLRDQEKYEKQALSDKHRIEELLQEIETLQQNQSPSEPSERQISMEKKLVTATAALSQVQQHCSDLQNRIQSLDETHMQTDTERREFSDQVDALRKAVQATSDYFEEYQHRADQHLVFARRIAAELAASNNRNKELTSQLSHAQGCIVELRAELKSFRSVNTYRTSLAAAMSSRREKSVAN